MIFVDRYDKLSGLVGKTMNVYSPDYTVTMEINRNRRILDRMIVDEIKGTCVCGKSLVTGSYVVYDAADYVQFFDAYKDEGFSYEKNTFGLDDLSAERE